MLYYFKILIFKWRVN